MQKVSDKRADENLAALLCALSSATGLAFGGHMDHGLGCAYLGLEIADELTLADEEREAIFYGALLKDVACTACSAGIAAFLPENEQVSLSDVILIDPSRISDMMGWLAKYLRLDAQFPGRIAKLVSFLVQCGPIVKETMRSHCEVAELFARWLGLPDHVQRALRFQWERWDGKGMAYGLKASSIPRAARILHLTQVLDLMYRFAGPEAAQTLAQQKRASRFDPEGVDAFRALAQRANFWNSFEEQSTQEALLARIPTSNYTQPNQFERVCEALADFIDLKTRETWHHSRAVAEVAVGIGIHLGLDAKQLKKVRCAALVHDVGKAAIPFDILTKGEQRSKSEWDQYRLHPYYTQCILGSVSAFRELAHEAAAHHEWVNGQGYHRQLSGEQIPFHGRILAVANAYTRLAQSQTGQVDTSGALCEISSLVDIQFDRQCYDALLASLKSGDPQMPPLSQPRKATNLTGREIEILSLLAKGLNTPQISRNLDISRKTVEHHLSHIYNKIGVTCRTAAVVYAVQQGLV